MGEMLIGKGVEIGCVGVELGLSNCFTGMHEVSKLPKIIRAIIVIISKRDRISSEIIFYSIVVSANWKSKPEILSL